MYSVGEYYDAINSFAPFATAEDWDNTGILIGGRKMPVGRALLALDLTDAVLDEAKRLKAGLVITHHPVIFRPLAALEADSVVYRAIAAGVAVISAHTNLDCAEGGVNDALAARLRLKKIRPFHALSSQPFRKIAVFVPTGYEQGVFSAMAEAGAGRFGSYDSCGFFARGEGHFRPLEGADPAIGEIGRTETMEEIRVEAVCAPDDLDAVIKAMRSAHPYEVPAYDIYETHGLTQSVSLGRMGELESPLAPVEFAAQVRESLGAAGLRYIPAEGMITRVAVCGGSGGELLYDAKKLGAHALVTAEVKHNVLLDAARLGITLVDAGHFATENPAMEPLRYKLSQLLPGAIITVSHACTDGVRYMAD